MLFYNTFAFVLVCVCIFQIGIIQGISVETTQGLDADEKWLMSKQLSNETASFSGSSSLIHVLRLKPNEDLLECLYKFVRLKNIKAASILSVVGSLKTSNIRYANQENGTSMSGYFEIVSLVGNFDEKSNSGHVHISISNEEGFTIGGHVLYGNIIYTTAEITLLEMRFGVFSRAIDDGPDGSGYEELKINHVKLDEL